MEYSGTDLIETREERKAASVNLSLRAQDRQKRGRNAYALRLRQAGLTFREIGSLMGVSGQTARNLVERANYQQKTRPHRFRTGGDPFKEYLEQLKEAELLP